MKLAVLIHFIVIVLTVTRVVASDAIESSVLFAGVDKNGTVFVQLADVVQEPGCANAQINLPSSVDYRKDVLSLALTAKTTGSPIVFKANGCHGTTPTINSVNSDNGYFYLK